MSRLLFACLLGISLSAAGIALSLAPAEAAGVPSGPHITVTGRGRVAVKPDQALLSLQITLETQDPSSVKQKIDRQVTRYLTFLKQQGIESSQIDASRLWSQRISDPESTVATKRRDGQYYRLSRRLTVIVRQLTQVESLLAEALRCGLQELAPVRFGVADESGHRQQALALAIQDAVQQAEQIARQFASCRGTVYSIHHPESKYLQGPAASFPAGGGSAQSHSPHSLEFSEKVKATFLLQP